MNLQVFDLSPVGPETLIELRRIVLPVVGGTPEPGRMYQAPVFSTDAGAEIYAVCAARFEDCTRFVANIESFAAQHAGELVGKTGFELWNEFEQNEVRRA